VATERTPRAFPSRYASGHHTLVLRGSNLALNCSLHPPTARARAAHIRSPSHPKAQGIRSTASACHRWLPPLHLPSFPETAKRIRVENRVPCRRRSPQWYWKTQSAISKVHLLRRTQPRSRRIFLPRTHVCKHGGHKLQLMTTTTDDRGHNHA
jgi:hypothetical protein